MNSHENQMLFMSEQLYLHYRGLNKSTNKPSSKGEFSAQQIPNPMAQSRRGRRDFCDLFALQKFWQNWIDIYIIIFENMNYVNNPFYQPYYYIIVPAQTCPFLQASATQSQTEPTPEINASPKSQCESVPAQIMVSREDLVREGYRQTKRAWSEEEDRLLVSLCSDQNVRFEEVARLIPGRNAKMCYSRFRRLATQSRAAWSRAENEKLARLVGELGREQWREIALQFPTRNHKQLKDHYENYLRPNLTTEQWTLEEDLLLIDLLNHHGKNWKLVQKKFPHRSRNQIKNRLFGRILRIHARNVQEGPQQ